MTTPLSPALYLRRSFMIVLAVSTALLVTTLPLPSQKPVAASPDGTCSAGTHYVDESNGGYSVLRFTNTSACDWTVPAGVTSIDVLLVGGGGGGGAVAGAGGGGGAVVTRSALAVTSGTYTVTVGAGGVGAHMVHSAPRLTLGSNGASSVISDGTTTVSASGGGVGGSWNGSTHLQAPGSSGPGGGSGALTVEGAGAPGHKGGKSDSNGQPHAAGGGAGAGGNGFDGSGQWGGAGGFGMELDFIATGVTVTYGGGGGGGVHGTWSGDNLSLLTAGLPGDRGPGGGGRGAAPTQSASSVVRGEHGTDGLGGGGGGAANNLAVAGGESIGGNGGRGVVVIRWLKTSQTITFNQPGDVTLSATTFDVAATSDSGLGVTMSASTPAICTIAGFTVTMHSAGTCTLTANQSGGLAYLSATPVTRSFTITPAASSASSTTTTVAAPASSPTSATSTVAVPTPPSTNTTTTTVPPTATTVPDAGGDDSCPCLVDGNGSSIPVTTHTTPTGQIPGHLRLDDDTSTIEIGGSDDGADPGLVPEGRERAVTWVTSDGLLTVQTPGVVAISGSGAQPGTTAVGGVDAGPTETATVDDDGMWSIEVTIPEGSRGTTTVTSSWTNVDGSQRTMTAPLSILPSGAAAAGPRRLAQGEIANLAPDEALAFGSDGALLPHDRSHDASEQRITVVASDVVVGLRPESNGQVTSDGRVNIIHPAQLRLHASGMMPGTTVDVWSMGEARRVGTARVGPDGTLEIVVEVPASTGADQRTLQIDTVDAQGRALSLAIGMAVGVETLPVTGPDLDGLLLGVMVLLTTGSALSARRPRRVRSAT